MANAQSPMSRAKDDVPPPLVGRRDNVNIGLAYRLERLADRG